MAASFKEALRRHLDSSASKSPDEIIESWQAENAIRLSSLDAALPLLDRVRVRRYEFYQSTADILRQKMLAKIAELAATGRRSSYKRMAELLEASFGYISVPALRPVPMTLLEHLSTLLEMHKPAVRPRLKEKYLKTIVSSKELYAAAPVAVKRYIWEDDTKLFLSEISPLLEEFVRARSGLAMYSDLEQPALTVPAKARRNVPVTQQLLQLIGTSSLLYEQTVTCLREKYKSTGSPAVCTLRMELLMALHDAKIDDVCVRDPLHKFAWVLDACGRDLVADARRLTELRGFYKTAKSGVAAAEVALLCACPHVQATLALCLLSQLDQLVLGAQLPRGDPTCRFLLRLLQLGLSAWELSRGSEGSAGLLSESVVACELLPSVARLRLETQLRLVARQTRRLAPAAMTALPAAEAAASEQKAAAARMGSPPPTSKKQKKQKQQQPPGQQAAAAPAPFVPPPAEDAPRPPALPLVCAGSRVGRLLARYHCAHVVRELRRTAPDMLQVSCDLLLDLLDALAPLDEEFDPMPLQWVAVQLCRLREAPPPPAAAAAAAAAAQQAKKAPPPPPPSSASHDAQPQDAGGDDTAAAAASAAAAAAADVVEDDAESRRQLDRCLQRLCARLLAPRAAKSQLAALLLARCQPHLPQTPQGAAAAAAARAAV